MNDAARTRWVALAVAAASGCGGSQLAWYGHSADRSRRVEVRQQGGGQWLLLEGRRSRSYRYIATHDLAFAPDGRRLAFAAEVEEHPERWSVVTDFVEGRSWDGVAGLRFGPDGRRFAYAALDGKRWRMVIDGVPQRPFDAVDVDSVTFSPDGKRVAYAAQDADCARTVIETAPGDCVGRVVGLALGRVAADDVRVVADAVDGSDAHVFRGVDRTLDLPRARALVVDAAVEHWAVLSESPQGRRLVVDGREQESFDEIDHVVWGPKGRIAYTARRGGAWHVVACERVSEPYKEVEEPVFATNGSHVGYLGRDPGKSVVAIDNHVIWESPAPATALVLSDDGSRVGWLFREGGSVVIAVDRERHRFEVAVERTLRFSRDSRHWAALVGSLAERRLFVVVDGVIRLPFDAEEFFGGSASDFGSQLGAWVSAELELHLARAGARGS
jgi:hypothetical protein